MKTLQLSILAILSIFIISCEKEKNSNEGGIGYQEHGIFIVNEGTFQANNGSVSYVDNAGHHPINDLFKSINHVLLGDVVQSMIIYNHNGYMVVNNSQKVEVVRMLDFQSIGTITGFSGPRYFLPVSNDKAYVSDWFSNDVKVVNLNTLSVTTSIPVGTGPEQMTISNNKVYVANMGGFGNDSTVSVIDIATNTVLKTINVGLNPNSIITRQNGEVLVLCGGTTGPDYIGGTADDIGGMLIQIDPVTDNINHTEVYPQSFHPLKLTVNKGTDKIYCLVGNDGFTGSVFEISTDLSVETQIIGGSYYGLGINPSNDYIYCGRAGFSAKCYFLRFQSNGTLVDSSLAGIAPNSFVFN